MNVLKLRGIPCGLIAASLLLWFGAPRASDAQEAAAPGDESEIKEIVVTATRRAESLSKVPVSVTALSQDSMDALGIKDFQDIVRFTPGVNIDNSGTNSIAIRGISSSGGAGTTGIYIDDTPVQMRALGFNPDDALPKTFDLDRVEVLRGPQGTLFGAGSEGGTVRYILTPPKLTGSSTYMRSEVSFSEVGQPSYEIGVARGAPMIDGVLGVRASVWYRSDGGWIDRVDSATRAVTESNANNGHALNLRVAAVWAPTAALTITPSFIYQDSFKHDASTYWPAYSSPDSGHFNNATPERIPVPDKYLLPSVKVEANFEHSSIIGTVSYYSRDEESGYQGSVYDLAYYQALGWAENPNTGGLGCGANYTATEAPCDWYPLIDGNGIHLPAGFENYSTPNKITNRQRSWTAEVRWQSTDDSSRWRWTAGAFWQQSKETSIEELSDPRINDFFTSLYGTDALSIFGDYYNCNGVGTYTAIPACDIYINDNRTTDRQFAVFGELSYALTDKLRLTVGERVARTTFSLDHYADGIENFGPSFASASHSETPNTPKVNLSYQMDARNLFYFTYAKGFRVGGGNPPLPSYCDADLAGIGFPGGAPLTYQSDSTQSFEVGSKNSIGAGFRVAASAYYIKWNNIQQSVYVAGGCGLQFTSNLGTAVAKGFDLQAEFAAGPMKFDVSAGYTDARYTKTIQFAPGVPPLANEGDAISGGASVSQAPGLSSPWTAAVGAQYNFEAAGHPAFVRFDYEFQSRNKWPATLQDPATSQYNPETYALSSTTFAQLRAGVNLGGWGISAFVDNLFDTHTVTNYQLGQIDGYNPTPPSEQQNQYTFHPRTYGITATYRL